MKNNMIKEKEWLEIALGQDKARIIFKKLVFIYWGKINLFFIVYT